MNKTITITLSILAFASFSFVMKNDGLEGRTGSPGETTCNTSGCHTGNQVNDPSGSIAILAPTMTNWEYEPGTTYPIQVTITRTGNQKFGLGFESLLTSGANGGTLSITNAVETQIKNAFVSGNSRANVVHRNSGGIGSGSKTFSFNWTAPMIASGNITFYAAGNASNSLNNTSGDFIYTTSQVLTPVSGVSVQEIELKNSLQIFPNPSSENISLSFAISSPMDASFTLVNLHGEKVLEVNSERFSAGTHHYNLNTPDEVVNGVYLLYMNTPSTTVVKKLVVMK